jgi:archaellum component FlaC
MQELMEWIYSKLSIHSKVYFEDLERNEEGEAVIDDIKIVYNIPNILQSLSNKIRKDIPFYIDIWGRKDQVLDIENLVEQLDKSINEEVYRSDTLFFIVQKQNNWVVNITDEDKNIRRKRLNYTIRFYK